MTTMTLTHSVLAFFALAMTIISFWVKKSPWIWGTFLLFAFVMGFFAKILEPIALAPIGALFVLHAFLAGQVKGLARFLLVVLTVAISLGLILHLFPGFSNWKITKTLWVNFDKPFIGIFPLALIIPLIHSPKQLGQLMKTAIPLSIAGIVIIAFFALSTGLIKWDPKLPKLFWFFAFQNLIFATIVEEAFWRGFVQNEFFRWFGNKGFLASCGAVLATAALFAALHYKWAPNLPFLGLVFIAGIIYGSIYQYTRALEASILAHWAFNLTHFFLFTYPMI